MLLTCKRFFLLVGGWLALTACTSSETAVPIQAAVQLPTLLTATTVPTATPLPPPVLSTVSATEAAMPAFALPDPDSVPTKQPTMVPTETVMPTKTAVPTETATPLPTFTPPSLPYTSPNEHYWFRRPIAEGGTVWTDKTYPYGHTRGRTLRTHHGVEFYVPAGTQVLATASGIVRVAGTDEIFAYGPEPNFYGNLVIIEHDSQWQGQPVYTLYAHLSDIFVREGDVVDMQQVIALSGASGIADGAHLHFEVRVGQNSYDDTRNPLLWLYPFPQRGAVAGQVKWADGRFVYEAPVTLRRLDATSNYAATTTYADERVNGDDGWQENFAFDDVEAGYYEIEVDTGEETYTKAFWVYPYQTSFVEIVLD